MREEGGKEKPEFVEGDHDEVGRNADVEQVLGCHAEGEQLSNDLLRFLSYCVDWREGGHDDQLSWFVLDGGRKSFSFEGPSRSSVPRASKKFERKD